MNNLLAGAVAGVGSRFASGFHPLAGPAVVGGVGYVMGNGTLQTIAGMQLGTMLTNGITGGTTNTGAWY